MVFVASILAGFLLVVFYVYFLATTAPRKPMTVIRTAADRATDKFADPRWARKVHGWLTIIWFVLAFPVCIFLATSLPFIVFISVYAVVTGHWAAWQAARTEVLQEEEANDES